MATGFLVRRRVYPNPPQATRDAIRIIPSLEYSTCCFLLAVQKIYFLLQVYFYPWSDCDSGIIPGKGQSLQSPEHCCKSVSDWGANPPSGSGCKQTFGIAKHPASLPSPPPDTAKHHQSLPLDRQDFLGMWERSKCLLGPWVKPSILKTKVRSGNPGFMWKRERTGEGGVCGKRTRVEVGLVNSSVLVGCPLDGAGHRLDRNLFVQSPAKQLKLLLGKAFFSYSEYLQISHRAFTTSLDLGSRST